MRMKLASLLAVGAVSALSFGSYGVSAAPVPGFEALYQAVLDACPPNGSLAATEAAINAYSAALVAANIDPEVALLSASELRIDAAEAGCGPEVDELFELLLPESGAIGDPQASPV